MREALRRAGLALAAAGSLGVAVAARAQGPGETPFPPAGPGMVIEDGAVVTGEAWTPPGADRSRWRPVGHQEGSPAPAPQVILGPQLQPVTPAPPVVEEPEAPGGRVRSFFHRVFHPGTWRESSGGESWTTTPPEVPAGPVQMIKPPAPPLVEQTGVAMGTVTFPEPAGPGRPPSPGPLPPPGQTGPTPATVHFAGSGNAGQVIATSTPTMPGKPAPLPGSSVKTPPAVLATSLRDRIESACGTAPGNVGVVVNSPTGVVVRFTARTRAEAADMSQKIFAIPELRPYRVTLEVKIAPGGN